MGEEINSKNKELKKMAKTHTNISESSSLKETELQSQIDALSSLNVTPFFFHTYLTFL
jgi:hypothetical protein